MNLLAKNIYKSLELQFVENNRNKRWLKFNSKCETKLALEVTKDKFISGSAIKIVLDILFWSILEFFVLDQIVLGQEGLIKLCCNSGLRTTKRVCTTNYFN